MSDPALEATPSVREIGIADGSILAVVDWRSYVHLGLGLLGLIAITGLIGTATDSLTKIVIAGVLATTMGSLGTALNSLATSYSRDFHFRWFQTPADEAGRVRIDDWEMRAPIQAAVREIWPQVTTENLATLTDIAGYRTEFLKLFGFGLPGINYDADTEPHHPML